MANVNDLHNQTIFRQGCKLVVYGDALTSIPAGTYCAIQFITDSRPAYLTTHYESGVAYGGINYKAGTLLYLDVASLRLGAAGEAAILYKRIPC